MLQLNLLDQVLLNLLSDTDHVGDAGPLELAEGILVCGGVRPEVEAGHNLLHDPPLGVGPVLVLQAHASQVDVHIRRGRVIVIGHFLINYFLFSFSINIYIKHWNDNSELQLQSKRLSRFFDECFALRHKL